jgi:hypothetical protein
MKKTWKLILAAMACLLVLMLVLNVNAGTLRYIYTDSSGTIVTNTITTAEPGDSGASLTYIYTDKDGTVVTNAVTTPTQQVPYFAKGSGYSYNTKGGYSGFFGTTPVVQPTSASQAAVATTGAAAVALTQNKVTLTNLNVLCGDGSTQSVWVSTVAASMVTNTAVNTVYGYTTSTQSDAIVTLVNAIRTALVNLGLIKGS